MNFKKKSGDTPLNLSLLLTCVGQKIYLLLTKEQHTQNYTETQTASPGTRSRPESRLANDKLLDRVTEIQE